MRRNPYRNSRRRELRIPLNQLPCKLKLFFFAEMPLDTQEGEGWLINFSRGGLCFTTQYRLPSHFPVLLQVRFVFQEKHFLPVGRIAWSRYDRQMEQMRYGMIFWGASQESIVELNEKFDKLIIQTIDYRI